MRFVTVSPGVRHPSPVVLVVLWTASVDRYRLSLADKAAGLRERMMARRRSVAALVERVTGFEDEAAVGCSDRIASRKGAADSEIESLH